MRTITAATLASVLTLAGCAGAPADTASAEEAFIAQVRDGAPQNTESDLTLLRNADLICDSLANSETAAERAELITTWDGDSQTQREFNRVYLDAATRYLCPDVHDDYLQAVDLADDGNLDGATGSDPTPSPSVTFDDLQVYAHAPTSEQLERMVNDRDDCINGDDFACNRLWGASLTRDPGGTFIVVAATCGGRVPAHRPENLDDITWAPCPVN